MANRAVISARAKAAGYTLVIDISGETLNNTPLILYANGENDITEAILTQINATAPPPAKADAKTDAKPAEIKPAK